MHRVSSLTERIRTRLWGRRRPEPPRPLEIDPAELLGPVPPPRVELEQVAIGGSELLYQPPFGPDDSIYDAWLKFQAFTSDHPVTVRITPSNEAAPVLTSSFLPNSTLHSTKEMFFLDLAAAIRTKGGPGAWQGVRRLSSFGIPETTREGKYHIYTGTLRMELKGVPLMGLHFNVAASFAPCLGWIPGHFSGRRDYFHCEMPNEQGQTVVGFPWTLTSVTLDSQDVILPTEGPKITRGIIGKHAKHVVQNQASRPVREDAGRKLTLISDGVVVVAIHEGIQKERRFLRIEYVPAPNGPIDEVASGDRAFLRFADSVVRDLPAGEETAVALALNTPF